MDEGVITEVIMIMVVLVIGTTLIFTMTPFLRSFSAPQAAPLVEAVYEYAQVFTANGSGYFDLYLYVYDNNPVDLYSINIFSAQDINVESLTIEYPDGTKRTFTSGSNLDLTLTKGLYNIRITFIVNNPNALNEVSYVVTLTSGHTISGDTVVKKIA